MDLDEIPLFAMLKGRMGYLAQRQQVIAQNVANSDTPGYKAKDMKPFSFNAAMQGGGGGGRGAVNAAGQLNMRAAPAQSAPGQIALPPQPQFGSTGISTTKLDHANGDSETTLDGNGVTLEDEMMKMSQARMDYDAAVGFYQKALGLLRMAARAPGK